MIILLVAMYDLRKRYTFFYRTFSFAVIYYINIMMTIKLIAMIYLSINHVSITHTKQKADNTLSGWSSFMQTFFGKFRGTTAAEQAKD